MKIKFALALVGAGQSAFALRLLFSFDVKREPENHQRFRRAGSTRKGLLAPFRPRRGCRSSKMLAASLNAFLGFSGLRLRRWCYAFAKLYVQQGRKVCCEAANRRNEKKCNSDDRRLRRIQGGVVGAAVSRTRVPLKARSGCWAPQPVLAQRLAFFRFDFFFGLVKGEQPLTRCGESGVQR